MLVTETSCRCGVPDWRALRLALGLKQYELARLLRVSRRQVIRLEKANHVCPREPVVFLLRSWLQSPDLQARLTANGLSYPWLHVHA